MRLFHLSEEQNIPIFHPRIPTRQDMDQGKGLVWAINERCLPNFLTPRNCPRVTYHCSETTSEADKRGFLSSTTLNHVVAIEHKWVERLRSTTLYLYEFNVTDFYMLDEGAGYYVSEQSQIPIRQYALTDLFGELFRRNVEVRIVDNLWDLCDRIQQTSFHYSMCRMGFAEARSYGDEKVSKYRC